MFEQKGPEASVMLNESLGKLFNMTGLCSIFLSLQERSCLYLEADQEDTIEPLEGAIQSLRMVSAYNLFITYTNYLYFRGK